MTKWTWVAAMLLVIVGTCACGGSRGSSADAAAAERARAVNLLQGSWVLVEFRPEQPLEPMFAGLLAAQLGRMIVTFDGQTLTAQGVGISAQRTYRVTEATGDGAKVVLLDQTGVNYEIVGTFRGNELVFTALTAPWRGTGRLQRQQ